MPLGRLARQVHQLQPPLRLRRHLLSARLHSSRRLPVAAQSRALSFKPSRSPTPTASPSTAPRMLVQQNGTSGYASLASQSTSQGDRILDASWSTELPSDKLAPSLSHLNSDVLPHGYERPPGGAAQGYAVFTQQLEQSPNDDRSYRLIRLDNGMEVCLVHDEKTDKAAAGISVRVGHLSDPENAQGMAHFCEHLLFMGTEKYPAENDYNDYLSKNNGMSNAYTGMDETVYFFDVHPPALPGALDRFAQFFIAPLFSDSCTEREILAVDSENKKNLQSDMWRMFQLEKSTSSRDHWYWRFGTGNKQTLWDDPKNQGRNVRDELISWYNQHYSANVMKLTVVGKDSLDDLTKLVVDTFSPVKNKKLPPLVFSGSPFGPQQLKQHVYAQAVKNIRSLEMAFPCPDQSALFATKPGNFITHYLGHEGEGSILSYLKKLGWAESLGAGAGQGATGFDFFKITINLTKAGLAHHQKVAAIVFAYIDMLRKTSPQEWAFREQSMLNEIGFRFIEKGKPMNYVTQMCTQMQKPYPREWLLSAPWLLKEWNPSLVQEQVEGLTPERCRITICSQDPLDGLEWDQKEQWYGTRYRLEPFAAELLAGGNTEDLSKDLFLPKPNSFIPSNLDIVGVKHKGKEPSRRPNCISETEKSRLWHKTDDRWLVPRAAVTLYIKNPFIDSSAINSVNTRVFLDLVTDAMNEYSYDADLAGLRYHLETQADGILMSIDGYNDKLPVLAKVVLEKMADLQVDPQRFEIIKDQNRRKYQNFKLSAPSQLSMYWTSYLTQNKVFTPEEKLEALEGMTPESLQAFIPQLFKNLFVEGLVHGNMLKDDAQQIMSLAENVFSAAPLPAEQRISPLSLLVPESSNMVLRLPVPNPEQLNSAIEYFCYLGDEADDAIRIRNSLFCQLINEPCFDTLRTKEQLGYLVHSSARASIGMTGFRISIQSERDAAYLESRIDAFLVQFEKYLEEMTPEKFEEEKMSLINRLNEDYKNLYQETGTYWVHIHSGYYDFERKRRDAAQLASVSKQDILDFFKAKIHPESKRRAKLSIHMQSQHVSQEVMDAANLLLSEAGVTPSQALQEQLKATPTPLIDDLVTAVVGELEAAAKGTSDNESIAAASVSASAEEKLRKLHSPDTINGNKVFTDVKEVRGKLIVGPPSKPVSDYRGAQPNL